VLHFLVVGGAFAVYSHIFFASLWYLVYIVLYIVFRGYFGIQIVS